MANGHWYTDKQGNHYFVENGQSPKEGWEASKRRKMISGGKYMADEGDGSEPREISKDEYDKYEADESDFDETVDDDFGFDEDDDYQEYIDKVNEDLEKVTDKKSAEYVADEIDNLTEAGYISEEMSDKLYAELDKKIDENVSGMPLYNSKLSEDDNDEDDTFMHDQIEKEESDGWKVTKGGATAEGRGGHTDYEDGKGNWVTDWGNGKVYAYLDGKSLGKNFGSVEEAKKAIEKKMLKPDATTYEGAEVIGGDDDNEGMLKDKKPLSEEESNNLDPNNPKYEGMSRSGITNAKLVDEGKTVKRFDDNGKEEKLSIIEYIPYGALQDGDNRKLYGVVSDYDGSDSPRIGAIVSPSLEGAKEELKAQIELAEQGRDRYEKRGKWDEDWFKMLSDDSYEWDEDTKNHYSQKYGWDFKKPWEEQEHIKGGKKSSAMKEPENTITEKISDPIEEYKRKYRGDKTVDKISVDDKGVWLGDFSLKELTETNHVKELQDFLEKKGIKTKWSYPDGYLYFVNEE